LSERFTHYKQQVPLRLSPQPPSTLVGLPFGSTMVDGVPDLFRTFPFRIKSCKSSQKWTEKRMKSPLFTCFCL
jgi:hypothetical protein